MPISDNFGNFKTANFKMPMCFYGLCAVFTAKLAASSASTDNHLYCMKTLFHRFVTNVNAAPPPASPY